MCQQFSPLLSSANLGCGGLMHSFCTLRVIKIGAAVVCCGANWCKAGGINLAEQCYFQGGETQTGAWGRLCGIRRMTYHTLSHHETWRGILQHKALHPVWLTLYAFAISLSLFSFVFLRESAQLWQDSTTDLPLMPAGVAEAPLASLRSCCDAIVV